MLHVARVIAIANEAFNGKKILLCDKINKNLRKRLAKCYVWSVALHGVETCLLYTSTNVHSGKWIRENNRELTNVHIDN